MNRKLGWGGEGRIYQILFLKNLAYSVHFMVCKLYLNLKRENFVYMAKLRLTAEELGGDNRMHLVKPNVRV